MLESNVREEHSTVKTKLKYPLLARLKTQVQARFPNGAAVVFAAGKTRTGEGMENLILRLQQGESLPQDFDPGRIDDMESYAVKTMHKYFDQISMLQAAGMTHIVITLFHYQAFSSRGDEYANVMVSGLPILISEFCTDFYYRNRLTPVFFGLEPLKSSGNPDHYAIAEQLETFSRAWPHQPGNTVLIWELFPTPIYSIYQYHLQTGDGKLPVPPTPMDAEEHLYREYVRKLYKIDLPPVVAYVGTSHNGYYRMRSALAGFSAASGYRMYFTPYPSLMMNEKAWARIIDDLLFGQPIHRSNTLDHAGQHSLDHWIAETERAVSLAEEGEVVGLVRRDTRH